MIVRIKKLRLDSRAVFQVRSKQGSAKNPVAHISTWRHTDTGLRLVQVERVSRGRQARHASLPPSLQDEAYWAVWQRIRAENKRKAEQG